MLVYILQTTPLDAQSSFSLAVQLSLSITRAFIFESRASYSLTQELTSGGVPIGTTLRANIVGSTDYRDEELVNEKILSREIV